LATSGDHELAIDKQPASHVIAIYDLSVRIDPVVLGGLKAE
jgi:hypothetical protein